MEQTAVLNPPKVVHVIEPTISVRESVKSSYRLLPTVGYLPSRKNS